MNPPPPLHLSRNLFITLERHLRDATSQYMGFMEITVGHITKGHTDHCQLSVLLNTPRSTHKATLSVPYKHSFHEKQTRPSSSRKPPKRMRGNIVAAGSAIAAMGAVGVNAVDHPTFKVSPCHGRSDSQPEGVKLVLTLLSSRFLNHRHSPPTSRLPFWNSSPRTGPRDGPSRRLPSRRPSVMRS